MPENKPGISIVGTGAVGTALARALAAQGYPLHRIVSRQLSRAEHLAAEVNARHASSLDGPFSITARLVFLCIPDDAIAPVASHLAAMAPNAGMWEGKIAAHTSGALSASALAPLGDAGAALMSLHPVQTFARSPNAGPAVPSPFANIYIGIEGDAIAVAAGKKIARALGARDLVLSAAYKPRYHLAAAIASNFFVTLMAMACDVLESIGISREEATAILRPLVTQTCTNVTTTLPEDVLTGPAARGDEKTLKMHAGAIHAHLPHYEMLYDSLLAHTLDLAGRSGRLNPEQIVRLKKTLKQTDTNND